MKNKVFAIAVGAVAAGALLGNTAWANGAALNPAWGKTIQNIIVGDGYADDRKPQEEKMTGDDVRKGLEDAAKELWGAQEEKAPAPAPAEPEIKEVTAREDIGGGFFAENQVPIIHQQIYETAGYLDTALESYGEVVDGEASNQYSFSYSDNIYINRGSADGVKPGDKFFISHMESEDVRHPVTKQVIGRKILMDGVIEAVNVTEKVSMARIIRSYDSIERGDRILPYTEMEPPAIDPDKPVAEKRIDGYLVTSRREKSHYGAGDVVYFDVGSSAGVEPGDVFDIIDTSDVVRQSGEIVQGLPKVIGAARVLSARKGTSTAYIYFSKNVIVDGDRVSFSASR